MSHLANPVPFDRFLRVILRITYTPLEYHTTADLFYISMFKNDKRLPSAMHQPDVPDGQDPNTRLKTTEFFLF